MTKAILISSILTMILTTSVCNWCASNELYLTGYPDCITPQGCKQRSFVVFGRTCVNSCPPTTKYFEDEQTCYKLCPNNTIEAGNRCENGTYCLKSLQVLSDGQCHDACKSGWMVFDNVCVLTCPGESIPFGKRCMKLNDCFKEKRVAYNRTCIERCPTMVPYTNNGYCVDKCPSNTVRYANTTNCFPLEDCVKQNRVASNDVCLESCPDLSPFLRNGRCYRGCPESTVVNGSTECISSAECTSHGRFVHNKTCIDSCPEDSRFVHGSICVSSCPELTVYHSTKCLNEDTCGHKLIFNKTCVESCPLNAPYTFHKKCVNTCPSDWFNVDMMCFFIGECMNFDRVRFNGTCLKTCPEHAPYTDGDSCYAQCPLELISSGKLTNGKGFQCIVSSECDSVVYNKTCLPTNECPESAPFKIMQQCTEACPHTTYPNGTICLPNEKCSGYIFNNTCVSICPSGYVRFTRTCKLDKSSSIGGWIVIGIFLLSMTIIGILVRTSCRRSSQGEKENRGLENQTRRRRYEEPDARRQLEDPHLGDRCADAAQNNDNDVLIVVHNDEAVGEDIPLLEGCSDNLPGNADITNPNSGDVEHDERDEELTHLLYGDGNV